MKRGNPFFGRNRPGLKRKGQLGREHKVDQESRVEKRLKPLGARKQPASGALSGWKGDITLRKMESFLFECKTTTKESLRVKQKWLIKISREAREKRKKPGLVIGFEDMPVPTSQDWIAVPADVFVELMKEAGY